MPHPPMNRTHSPARGRTTITAQTTALHNHVSRTTIKPVVNIELQDADLRAYSRAEVQERLGGICSRSVDRLINSGQLKAVPGTRGKGKRPLITARSLAQYIYSEG
ncbi:hypothetical protein N24_1761 [Corynebacterium suranareeae]|uniref:Helix-turn-helix domain-containing protein n=1 Tax=Corynebacterium suranareeae TaxID=2506452 RepID=A0A160PS92_9CORY|nr:hypothetical protein [Corynebacterium suranareeae]BAU96023.1 hypothetical protein N24_1761 [Corynebacterium suranareeae]